MANWTDSFIEIPFKCDGRDRNGCDCYGLICLIYRERLGIILPDYAGIFTDHTMVTLKKVARTMEEGRKRWALVDKPSPYDMVMLRTGRYVWHVGLAINKCDMIHTMAGIGSAIESFQNLYWKHRVVEFRRWNRA